MKNPIKEIIKDFIKKHGLIGNKFIDPDGNIHEKREDRYSPIDPKDKFNNQQGRKNSF